MVHHDDDDYVYNNENVKTGLGWENIKWAFTSGHAANWHPLTWISHQLDVQLFGLNPYGHHMTNLILHGLNTLLLFFILARMTQKAWRSGLVAALFATHPLNVESVAWISERKNVLCVFFMMLTILSYIRYVKGKEKAGLHDDTGIHHNTGDKVGRKSSIVDYLLVILCFSLGLLCKPMLVTLPFALLLLDYWPLNRLGKQALLEKVHLILLSLALCVITMNVQKEGGAMQSFGIFIKISNALDAYMQYVFLTLWPHNLCAAYPHPEALYPWWRTLCAVLLLGAITYFAIRLAKRRPYLPVGWFWFLGTLVPVIGIVQVGNQAMADRYAYIPLIGLFIIIAWGLKDLLGSKTGSAHSKTGSSHSKTGGAHITGVAVSLVLIILMVSAHKQVTYWKDSVTLFNRALKVTKYNYLAEHDLGMAMIMSGNLEGIKHIKKAIKIKPEWGVAYANLAIIHFCRKQYEDAWECVKLCKKYDCPMTEEFEQFIRDLNKAMPEPK